MNYYNLTGIFILSFIVAMILLMEHAKPSSKFAFPFWALLFACGTTLLFVGHV